MLKNYKATAASNFNLLFFLFISKHIFWNLRYEIVALAGIIALAITAIEINLKLYQKGLI